MSWSASRSKTKDRRFPEPALRHHQSGPGRTARCGPHLHDLCPGDDGQGRLADDCLPHARPQAVLWRDVFSPGAAIWSPAFRKGARTDSDSLAIRPGQDSGIERRGCRSAQQGGGTGARRGGAGGIELKAGFEAFSQSFDKSHGGFGDAPKFPRPSVNFLTRY